MASSSDAPRLTIGQCATLACLMEATAPKLGNVHRGADFEDMTYFDLVASAVLIAPAFDAAPGRSLGQTVFDAVAATHQVVGQNTNLGIVLLLAPLAMVPRDVPLPQGVPRVLDRLTPDDARLVYQAISLARPGGLGRVPQADVAGEPPGDLVSAMRLAAKRDLVARQYANGFQEVLGIVVPELLHGMRQGWPLGETIVRAQLRVMSRFPDSLIARKCGPDVAQRASDHAAAVLAAGLPGEKAYLQGLADLDFWLRTDGHRRNPGTTADLLAAGLFALLRDGFITEFKM